MVGPITSPPCSGELLGPVTSQPFHLLCSQTSCYRYWGQGIWTDYGREICRRLEAILTHDV